jgi:peptidoglycan/LPS O-acetylase OafA/YrhL
LLAALQVLYGHAIANLDLCRVPVSGDIIGFFSGVPIFFTLSGFLILKSIGRSYSYIDYAKKDSGEFIRN